MNPHVLADRATAVIGGAFAGSDRFFARSLESPPLEEVVRSTRVQAPEPEGVGVYQARAGTPAGALDPAFRIARWEGPGRPTLLYLQGSGERPFDFGARSKNTFRTVVLDAEDGWGANLCVLRAPTIIDGTGRGAIDGVWW
jgi:hypothetical protein